jgi:Cys-tRNA(Pro)/Cys-tRNA(Cys) deacylase
MPKERKLNSMRVLERYKVRYEVLRFPEGIHSADRVADHLGLPYDQVYKTLVLERSTGGKHLLVMVAADRALNLKKLARCLGEKRLRMATHAEAERITGLQVGGISVLALMNRGFQIFLDQPALTQAQVVVSAGRRGVNLRLAPADLVRVTGAVLVETS